MKTVMRCFDKSFPFGSQFYSDGFFSRSSSNHAFFRGAKLLFPTFQPPLPFRGRLSRWKWGSMVSKVITFFYLLTKGYIYIYIYKYIHIGLINHWNQPLNLTSNERVIPKWLAAAQRNTPRCNNRSKVDSSDQSWKGCQGLPLPWKHGNEGQWKLVGS